MIPRWGIAAPDEVVSERLNLDMGLRRAVLYYAELSVPGIGGVFFVRQLVWPCLALALKSRFGVTRGSTTTLATAIEALASKLWHASNPDAESGTAEGRAPGVRILPRQGWSFRELAAPGGYVTNPLRRAASRALPAGIGLGFAQGGVALNRMVLTEIGENLVESILNFPVAKGGKKLSTWIRDWVLDDGAPPTEPVRRNLLKAIGPFDPDETERRVVRARLMSTTASTPIGMTDHERRLRLIQILRPHLRRRRIDLEKHILEPLGRTGVAGLAHVEALRTALAFRRMQYAALTALASLAKKLGAASARHLRDFVTESEIADRFDELRSKAKSFLESGAADSALLLQSDASRFAEQVMGSLETAIFESAHRASQVVWTDDRAIFPGPSFGLYLRRLEQLDNANEENVDDEDAAPNSNVLPPRISNLMKLLTDCTER